MKIAYDVLIVGGGMVGSLLACALGDSAFKVGVVEREAPRPAGGDYDLRVSAITLASRTVFQALGAWEAMTAMRVSPLREMHVWDAGGNGEIHFDSAAIGEPCLGYIIENSVILSALNARLQQFTNIHYLCPAEHAAIDIRDDWTGVTLKDGRMLHARLLVGADGANSPVREAAGISTRGWSFGQQGIVATVITEKAHAHTAWQRFLPTGPLAFLPLDEPRHSSIVWSADNDRAQVLFALGDEEFRAELQQAFGSRLGEVISVGQRAAFPLALSHARAYVAPRVALVGDAAHVVHPLAGQGVNLGFLDAATLAEVLLNAAGRKKDIGALAVLRRYERWRKADNLAMLALTDGFKRLFGNSWSVVSRLRNLGLSLADTATLLKNIIMRRAAGLEGDLPRLARPGAGGDGRDRGFG